MYNFNTADEKAVEWGISIRYAQDLCRRGKVAGAIKRAGIWFIPALTENPVKNTKSDASPLNYKGTKKNIFERAVELFAQKSYELVAVKDIANEVGIGQSAFYNHFKSKGEILDAIYDYYGYHFMIDRPRLEDLELVFKEGNLLEIFERINYDFSEEYRERMVQITRIIFQRRFIDDRARDISKSLLLDEGIEYVEDVFKRGIEVGRLAPFDVHAIAVIINSLRLYVLYNYTLDQSLENQERLFVEQQNINRVAEEYLKHLQLEKGLQ